MKNLHRNVVIFCMKTFIMPITWLIYIYIYIYVCVCVCVCVCFGMILVILAQRNQFN